MQKIFEIKGDMFSKGLSVQTGSARGGLFRLATGFDPFERVGFAEPSLASTELTAPSTNPIKIITHWNDGTDQNLYAHSESKLYKYLRNSPYTRTDVTTEIDITDPSTFRNVVGAIVWKDKYIYAQSTDLRSNSLPVASGNDTQILNGATGSNLDVRKLCIGADKYLYAGDLNGVAKVTNASGTSGNSLNAFAIDSQHTVRDLVNDGRYLVIFADNNVITTTGRLVGNYSCRVYFWDMSKATADIIWDFPGESYLIGARMLGDAIVVFGYNGIYLCNSTTKPKMIFSFLGNSTITKRPANPYQIASSPTSVYWADSGSTGQNIYAYGSLPGSSERIFYSPYMTHGSTYAHTALSYSAGVLFAAVDSPKFYALNTGTTRGILTISNTPMQLPQPYRYGFAKVVLRSKMSSGQSVTYGAFAADGTVISDNVTRSYSAAKPRKTLIFPIKPTTGSVSEIDDIYFNLSTDGGAIVERIAVYGEALEDARQTE